MIGPAIQAAREVLARQRALDKLGQFDVAVDTEYLTDYLTVVTTPMDLGTVGSRLESQYTEMEAFIEDVRLVYKNSIAYCKTRHAGISDLAKSVLKAFNRECETALRPFLSPGNPLQIGGLQIGGNPKKKTTTATGPKAAAPKQKVTMAQPKVSKLGGSSSGFGAGGGGGGGGGGRGLSVQQQQKAPPVPTELAMSDSVLEALRKCTDALKRNKHSAAFKAPIDTQVWVDYEPKVGPPMDISKLEARLKVGYYKRDVGGWLQDARKVVANCLRFNTDVRYPDLRDAAVGLMLTLERSVDATLRPACVDSLRSAAGADHARADRAEALVEAALPRLLPKWKELLKCLEKAVLEEFEGPAQACAAFLHPIASYYVSNTEPTLLKYLDHIKRPKCVGDVVSALCGAGGDNYTDPSQLDADVKLVFENALKFYGPNCPGRKLHGREDADAYVKLARTFLDRWGKAFAKVHSSSRTNNNTITAQPSNAAAHLNGGGMNGGGRGWSSPPLSAASRVVASPGVAAPVAKRQSPKGALLVGEDLKRARRALRALLSHKLADGYETATPFLGGLPAGPEYAEAIEGIRNARNLVEIGGHLDKGTYYKSLEDFENDVKKCLDNARKWKDRSEAVAKENPKFAGAANQASETFKLASMLEAVFENEMEASDDEEEEDEPLKKQQAFGGKEPRSQPKPTTIVKPIPRRDIASATPAAPPPPVKQQSPPKRKAEPAVAPVAAPPARAAAPVVRAATPPDDGDDEDEEIATAARVAVSAAASSSSSTSGSSSSAVNSNGGGAMAALSKRQGGPSPPPLLSTARTSPPPASTARRASPPPASARASPPQYGGRSPKFFPNQPQKVAEPKWKAPAEKLYQKIAKHEWVKLDGEMGRIIRWHAPAVESFPALRDAYLAKISQPMDLGTVKRRLDLNEYTAPQKFVDDLALVFDNAKEFNRHAKEAAAAETSDDPDDIAIRVFDIAVHLREWIEHLANEYFANFLGSSGVEVTTIEEKHICQIEATKDDVGLQAAKRRAVKQLKPSSTTAGGALSSTAVADFVAAAAAKKRKEEAEVKKQTDDAVEEKKQADGAATAVEKPKPAACRVELSSARALELRKKRDGTVWPSSLRTTHKSALAEARAALRALRKQQLKKHTGFFDFEVRGVPDYSQYVARPTCLGKIERKIGIPAGPGEEAQAAAAMEPYETLGEFAEELRRVFTNATAYNERYRLNEKSVSFQICAAIDVLRPVVEDALFNLAVEAYERVGRERIGSAWLGVKLQQMSEETAVKVQVESEMRDEAKRKIEEVRSRDRTSTKEKREKTLRLLSRACVANLDVTSETSLLVPKQEQEADAPAPSTVRLQLSTIDLFRPTLDDERRDARREAALRIRAEIAKTFLNAQDDTDTSTPTRAREVSMEKRVEDDNMEPSSPGRTLLFTGAGEIVSNGEDDDPRPHHQCKRKRGLSFPSSSSNMILDPGHERVAFSLLMKKKQKKENCFFGEAANECTPNEEEQQQRRSSRRRQGALLQRQVSDEEESAPSVIIVIIKKPLVVRKRAAPLEEEEESYLDASTGDSGWVRFEEEEDEVRVLISSAELGGRRVLDVAILRRAALVVKGDVAPRVFVVAGWPAEEASVFFRTALSCLRDEERRRRSLDYYVNGARRADQYPAPASTFQTSLLLLEASPLGFLEAVPRHVRRAGRPHVERRLVCLAQSTIAIGARKLRHAALG